VNDRGGDGAGCFDVEELADTTELTIECESCRTWEVQLFGRRKTCLSKIKPRLRAESVALGAVLYLG